MSAFDEKSYYEYCLAHKIPYFGNIMWAVQGLPVRHAYMQLLVKLECRDRAGKNCNILEIGTWAGGSAITWADAIKKFNNGCGRVVCVDSWVPYFDSSQNITDLPEDARQSVYEEMTNALSSRKIYDLYEHNIRAANHADIVLSFKGFSDDIIPVLAENYFEIVFIDGNHKYSHVIRDIKNAFRIVAEGGILCGDDLELQFSEIDVENAREKREMDFVTDPKTNQRFHPGVSLAVGELLGDVSAWAGFWAMRKVGQTWEKVELPQSYLDEIVIPQHLTEIERTKYKLQQNQAEQERKNFQSSSNIDIDFYVENYDLSSVEYNRIHAVRFYYSYCWIEEYLKENTKVVDLGSPGLFTYIIKDLHKSVEITNTTKDLRYEFDLSSNEFDIILNMEVIEHIKDREPTDFQDFHELSLFSMTGVQSFLSECNRVLKPDGLMLLTTPNMNSLQNIHRILNYLPPMNYYPHVREYTIGELVNWVKEHGFDILKIATYDVYGDYKQGGRAEMRALLDRIGVSNEYRGDNIFMLLKKVNPQTGKGDETIAEPFQSETGNLKDINFIIFPDWSQSEESICLELERVIRMLANHPDKSRINLIVDTSNISDEDANLLLTSVTMNLMMQEDLDVTDGPEISLVGSLNKIKWSELLPSLHSRIILENENKMAIAQAGAEKILSFTLDSLTSQQII